MSFIKACEQKLKSLESNVKIAFIEGHAPRMIAAAKKLQEQNILTPLMVVETKALFNQVKNDLGDLDYIVIEENKEMYDKLATYYAHKRKDKESEEKAFASVKKGEFFACLLVETGEVDGAIGGVELSTANVLRAAFKVIGPKKGVKTISSIMIMSKDEETFILGDISVNPHPKVKQLVDIAVNATNFVKDSNQVLGDLFQVEEKVAFLSFATAGSAETESTKMVVEATNNFNQLQLTKEEAIGEVQFDAAILEEIRAKKYPKSSFKGSSKILIFPDLNAGNIGYKIAQRWGNFSAMGPIIVGINKPINDLSRGSTVQNVFDSAIVTAIQAYAHKKEMR